MSFPIWNNLKGDNYLLKKSELTGNNRFRESLGFTLSKIKAFTKFNSSEIIEHEGCVNSVKWTNNGQYLVTGSDDKTVKIWDSSRDLENGIKLIQTIKTSHRGNIFCAELSPIDNNICISCAADGALILNHLNDKHSEAKLRQSNRGLIHMFSYDIENPMIVYTAEDSGVIARVDLRTKLSENIFLNVQRISSQRGMMSGSVKALCQNSYLGNTQLVLGGQGFPIGILSLCV